MSHETETWPPDDVLSLNVYNSRKWKKSNSGFIMPCNPSKPGIYLPKWHAIHTNLFSNSYTAFIWKLCNHWLKVLCQPLIAAVRQDPVFFMTVTAPHNGPVMVSPLLHLHNDQCLCTMWSASVMSLDHFAGMGNSPGSSSPTQWHHNSVIVSQITSNLIVFFKSLLRLTTKKNQRSILLTQWPVV